MAEKEGLTNWRFRSHSQRPGSQIHHRRWALEQQRVVWFIRICENRRPSSGSRLTKDIDSLKKDRFVAVSSTESGSTREGRFGFP